MAFTAANWGRGVLLTGLTPSASLSGYVALVDLSNIPVEAIDAGANSALNGGGDLRFSTDIDGLNQLPLEVVSYVTNATAGNRSCQLWIRFPTYASGTREVYMYYNKAGEVQPTVGAAFGRNAVYADREYQYNLHDVASIGDSTGTTTPTTFGTITDLSVQTPFGSGVYLQSDGYIDLNQNIADTVGDITLRAWVRPIASASFGTILGIRDGVNWSYQWRLESTDPAILIGSASPNSPVPSLGVGATWYLLTLTISGTTITFYRDGISQGTGTVTGARTLNPTIDTLIGSTVGGGATLFVNSGLAGVSVEEVSISASMVSSEYNNQSSPSTFWTTGTPFTPSGSGISITASFEKATLSLVMDSFTASQSITGDLDKNATNLIVDDFTASQSISANFEKNTLAVTMDHFTIDEGSVHTVTFEKSSIALVMDNFTANQNITAVIDKNTLSLVMDDVPAYQSVSSTFSKNTIATSIDNFTATQNITTSFMPTVLMLTMSDFTAYQSVIVTFERMVVSVTIDNFVVIDELLGDFALKDIMFTLAIDSYSVELSQESYEFTVNNPQYEVLL